LIDYIDRLIITLALPAIGEQFHLDDIAQGGIVSAFFAAYALAQVPGGMLADRFGSKPIMITALCLWSAFTALTGAAFSYASLLLIRFAFGICQGIFPGASMKATAERTERDGRLTATGVMLASNTIGAAAAPLVAARLIASIGWQQAF
jgi:MFS family permease